MNKYLSKGDYAAFISLMHWSYILIRNASRKERFSFLALVGVYIASIFLQGFAIGLFYFGVQHYIDDKRIGYITKALSYLPLEFTKVEQLLISLAPAILFLMLSSKVLSLSRVGLSRLVLRFRDNILSKYKDSCYIILSDGDETFFKNIDGTFGAMRALFLNAFVFAQAIVSLCVLIYFEPLLAFFNLLFFVLFMLFLTRVKNSRSKLKKDSQKEALEAVSEAAAELEGVGISSKSFERLERMRIYGRNATNLALFTSIFVGVLFSLNFLTSLDKLTLILFLLRYISNIYTPIAVISASCMPFKNNLVTLINIENYTSLIQDRCLSHALIKDNPSRGVVFISKSFGDRGLFIDPKTYELALLKYKGILDVNEIRIETTDFAKDYPRDKWKIKKFISENLTDMDRIFFLV
ncbi:TPA: hypothetical protein ACX6DV_002928 [Vibrio cholerae]|nr:hypothetical protein [Vibrio cholerae]BCN18311.1 putative O-antigen flippase [Vibrio cholerae]BCN20265.1 putative O-antigen flippase [Vibrio cholerae]GHX27401.1 hypothetical protein VCSRO157_2815 [Vibrio cholerae]GIA08375.1 hypothetical protein VCSRO36_2114 [Vibrio cholerae]